MLGEIKNSRAVVSYASSCKYRYSSQSTNILSKMAIPHCGHFATNFLITIREAGSSAQHSIKNSSPGFSRHCSAILSFSIRQGHAFDRAAIASHSPTENRRIISANATASPSGVYTTSPDIAITILCFYAQSNQSFTADLTCADSGFRPSLQAATNTACGDLTYILHLAG